MAASPKQLGDEFDLEFEEVDLASVPQRWRDLTGVYIAKGRYGFYIFSISITETRVDSVNFTVKNIATPFRLAPDDMAKITTTRCLDVTVSVPFDTEEPKAHLDIVKHNALCGLGKELPRGAEGTVDLVLTGLQLIDDTFAVGEISFVDASEIDGVSLRNTACLPRGKHGMQDISLMSLQSTQATPTNWPSVSSPRCDLSLNWR